VPAPAVRKKGQLTVELALKQTSQRVGLTHSAHVITPEFAKHLLPLNFAGNDQDNLEEGVKPFALLIVDH
jgi:hypothetical protein